MWTQNNHIISLRGMIKESTQKEIIDQDNPNQFDYQHQRFLQFTQQVIGYLTTNKDIHTYLQKINLSSATLIQEYHQIQTIHQKLSDKYRQHPVVSSSLTRNWNFINGFIQEKDLKNKDSKGNTVQILEVQAKIGCLFQLMMAYRQQITIANSPKEHYEKTWEKIKVVEAKDVKKIAKDMNSLKKLMFLGTSAILSEQYYESTLAKKLVFSLSMSVNFFMSDSAKLQSFAYYRNPHISHAKDLWNMSENGVMWECSRMFFESIKVNKQIWIPPNGEFSEQTDVFTQKQGHIPVRILYNGKMKFYENKKEQEEMGGNGGSRYIGGKRQLQDIEKILIYIHGGGFISLSSRSSQVFTRHWANQLKVPIFCIDYRMPPQHPFPQPVYDCFVVYQFIMRHISHFINVDPKEIYVAGDSAGGNLASSMTALLLKHKIPLPLGLYLVFPAMDIRLNAVSQSVVYTLTDPFLWPGCMRMCLSEYLCNDNSKGEDPLASPALLSEQFVSGAENDKRFPLQWPRTIMTVGDNDPLMDGVLLAMDRMVESGVDCQLVLYKQLCHGFIALGQVVEECQKTLDDSIVHLRDIMNIPI